MLVDQRERKALVIGAWFGVSVLFRPAAMLMPLGAVLWMLLVQRATYKRVMLVITGVVLVVAVGFAVDSIAYGALTSTLGNYLTAVLTGEEAARFTTLPWYQYPLFVLKYATLPIGSLIILAFALLIALERKHVLVWILLPFLVVHSMIGVKEARFLFPLAPLVPWLLISTWETLQERWPVMMSKAIWLRLLFLFAAVNALALVIGILTPAGNGKIKLAEAIHEHYGDQAVHIDHMGNWREWIPPFFLAPKSTEAFVEKIIVQPKVTGPNHLVMAPASMDLDRIANLERIATGAPGWTAAPMRWYLLEDAPDPLVLYRVHTGVPGH